MHKKKPTLVKIIDSFNPDNKIVFTAQEEIYRDRLLYILKQKVKNLTIKDYDLYKKVYKKFQVSFPVVCNDIMVVERMVANDRQPNGDPHKIWMRYMVTELAKEAYNKAKKNGEAYNMAYAANVIGKNNLTDREDVVKPDYEDIVPFIPEITSDPSILGIKPMEKKSLKALKNKMLKKYSVPELIEEAEIIKPNGEDKEEILP